MSTSPPNPQPQDTLVIDPVRMNILNRVAEGCVLEGQHHYKGGLLLQGALAGSGEIGGRLVVWHSGQLRGHFKVMGDMYVLGCVGQPEAEVDESTRIECHGTLYLGAGALCTGHLSAARLQVYQGATCQGPFTTLRPEQTLPVLSPAA